jgi:hypothetical protein
LRNCWTVRAHARPTASQSKIETAEIPQEL